MVYGESVSKPVLYLMYLNFFNEEYESNVSNVNQKNITFEQYWMLNHFCDL